MRYDPVAITLHWLIAGLMIPMLCVSFFLGDLPDSIKGDAYTMHKSIGITVLALSLFRLMWRLLNPPPALPTGLKPWERRAAKTTHWLFYVLMLAMPMTGWLMVSASKKYPTVYFWLAEVPFLPLPAGIDSKATAKAFSESHELIAIAGLVLLALHIGAALKHRFIYRDGVLTRMLPERRTPERV